MTVVETITTTALPTVLSPDESALLARLVERQTDVGAEILASKESAEKIGKEAAGLFRTMAATETKAMESKAIAGAYVHRALVQQNVMLSKDVAALLKVDPTRVTQYGYVAKWLFVVGGEASNPLHRSIADKLSKSKAVRDAVLKDGATVASVEQAYTLATDPEAKRQAATARQQARSTASPQGDDSGAGSAATTSTAPRDSAPAWTLPASLPVALDQAEAMVAKFGGKALPAKEWVRVYELHSTLDAWLNGDETARAAGMALLAKATASGDTREASPATVAKAARTRKSTRTRAAKASVEQAPSGEPASALAPDAVVTASA